MTDALWDGSPPQAADAALRALLSRLRRALHRAESAVALERWADAWAPASVARYISQRPFLRGEEACWIDAVRGELDTVRLLGISASRA